VGSGFFLVLLALFAFMYFLLIRPQRQRERTRQHMLGNLKVGDEVITGGGIYGEVVEIDTERVMVEVDEDVRIAVARQAIAAIVPPEELERLESGEGSEAKSDGEPADEPLTAEEPKTAEEREATRS
jgi:preprotein translocase subunit YajC